MEIRIKTQHEPMSPRERRNFSRSYITTFSGDDSYRSQNLNDGVLAIGIAGIMGASAEFTLRVNEEQKVVAIELWQTVGADLHKEGFWKKHDECASPPQWMRR